MSDLPATADQGPALLALDDRALPEVYGYLLRRCDGPAVADDVPDHEIPWDAHLDGSVAQGVPFQLWQPGPGC